MLFVLVFAATMATVLGMKVDKFATAAQMCGYTPLTNVRDYAVLDLDHEAIRHRLTLGQIQKARNLYEMGGNSFPVARLTLTATPEARAFSVGTKVYGETKSKAHTVVGTLLEAASWENGFTGNVTLQVGYFTSFLDELPEESQCRVGGYYTFQRANMNGCFTDESGTVELVLPNQTRGTGVTFPYAYNIRQDNVYYHTLQTLSTKDTIKNKACPDCPYFADFARYVDYYGSTEFGNHWILAAAASGETHFTHGNANFHKTPKIGLAEAVMIGILMLNVHLKIIQGVEQAVVKCNGDCENVLCNEEAIHFLDSSVALYCGSVEGEAGLGEGVFQYALAQRRAAEFGVDQPGKTTNDRIMALFQNVQDLLLQGDCVSIMERKKEIISLLKVPLVQSVLRFAYLRDNVLVLGVDDLPKAEAFGGTYAAALLPLVHECHRSDAKVIYENLHIGSETSSVSFQRVKEALEKNYDCMGISCQDIGGIWTEEGFAEGAAPCIDGSNSRLPQEANSPSAGVVSLFGISAITMVLVVVAYFYAKRFRGRRRRRHHSRAPSGNIAAVSSIS